MKKEVIKSSLLAFAVVASFIGILFVSARLPFMEVVRKNMENRIDSDAYFYTEVEEFSKYEAAVAQKSGIQHLFQGK
ncbi:MAG: hypothetical protein P8Z37_00310 [Acidobacteriota bacterium]